MLCRLNATINPSSIGAAMRSDEIKRIDAVCRRGFDYRADVVDRWQSFYQDVLAGRRWAGDCDDLTTTTLDALGRNGAARSNRWRLMVSAEGTGYVQVNHMVGAIRDHAGTFWIVGDTFGSAYPSSQFRHGPRFFQRMDFSSSGRWQAGVPF